MGNLRKDKQKAHPKTVETTAKVQQAMQLRAAGASYAQIGQALKCTKKYAFDLVLRGLYEAKESIAEDVEQVRLVELMRLDSILMELWQARKDPRTADTILRISERRSKLLGLDAAAKNELSGPDGGPIPIDQDITITFVEPQK